MHKATCIIDNSTCYRASKNVKIMWRVENIVIITDYFRENTLGVY